MKDFLINEREIRVLLSDHDNNGKSIDGTEAEQNIESLLSHAMSPICWLYHEGNIIFECKYILALWKQGR